MLKTGLSLALLVASSTAFAQPAQTPRAPTPPANATPPAPIQPPPAFIQAAEAFGQCVEGAIEAIPATTTPEATASQALASCAAQKTAIQTQFDSWIASDTFPAEGREIARQQFQAQMGQAEAQLAGAIRQQRAAPAATPPATPSN